MNMIKYQVLKRFEEEKLMKTDNIVDIHTSNKMEYKTPGDIAVEEVQKRLDEAGVVRVHLSWRDHLREDVASDKVTVEQVKLDVARLLSSHLNGDCEELAYFPEDDTPDLPQHIQDIINNTRLEYGK